MARDKLNQANIDNSDPVNYPNGRIKNNTGSGDGTPINEKVYGDLHETFAKLMRLSGLTYNNLPDNEQNGYQLISGLISLASKNDYMRTIYVLGTTGKVGTNINLDRLEIQESLVCLSSIDVTTETVLQKGTGGQTGTGIALSINYKGETIKTGDYVRFVRTTVGCDLIKLADGDSFGEIAATLGYLQAASQGEEDAGAITTKATTPLTNFTTFSDRINGVVSDNFLATQLINGLFSAADKTKLDNLQNEERNVGTFGPLDVDTGSVGDLYTVSGDMAQAEIVSRTDRGQIIQITLNNAMDSSDYEPRTSIESLGTMNVDNGIYPLIFKIIDASNFQIYLEESTSGSQNIKIHVATIQR